MSENLFAVVFTTGAEKGVENVLDQYRKRKSFQLADNIVIVASDELSSEIAEAASLTQGGNEQGITGAVFKLNGAYAGYARGDLWEWIEKVENA